MDYKAIICALIGGVFALVGGWLSSHFEKKNSDTRWKRDQKFKIYVEVIGLLKKLKIPCLATEQALKEQKIILDIEELNIWVNSLHLYIEEQNACLYLYLPKKVYKELIILSSEIVDVIENPVKQSFSFEELKNSSVFKALDHANRISTSLKADLKL